MAKQLEEKPISIPRVIRNENLDFAAESIGIVAPVYGHEVPPMVKEFMEKAAFHTDYFYMVLTYGNRHGGAAELTERFCRACGILPMCASLPAKGNGIERIREKSGCQIY